MNKFDFKYLTPFKWFVLENFPFIEADFDALTNWQLFCKLGAEMNKIINSQNTVGTQMENVTNAFIELQNYVNNYFENLDVQEEINNKLDALVEDGTLTNLISSYLTPYIDEQNNRISQFENQTNTTLNDFDARLSAVASGSPLVASSTDGMTDTTKVYVNTSNGYWYYYNGTQWVSGGVYQASSDSDTVLAIQDDVRNINAVINDLHNVTEYIKNTNNIDKKIYYNFEAGKKYAFYFNHDEIQYGGSTSFAIQFFDKNNVATTTDIYRESGNVPARHNINSYYECDSNDNYGGIRIVLRSNITTNVKIEIKEIKGDFIETDETETQTGNNFIFPYTFEKNKTYTFKVLKQFRFGAEVSAYSNIIKLLKSQDDLQNNIQEILRLTMEQAPIANDMKEFTFTADDDYNYISFYVGYIIGKTRYSLNPPDIVIFNEETENEIELNSANYLIKNNFDVVEDLIENTSVLTNNYTGQKINLKQNKFNYKKLGNIGSTLDSEVIQGMDIYNNCIFQLYDTGLCKIINKETLQDITNFALGSNISTNHCGTACFGKEFPSGNTDFPAFYVSGDLTNFCCYVENINLLGSTLIQKIDFSALQNTGYNGSAVVIDKDTNKMYYIQRVNSSIWADDNIIRIRELNLPKLSDGQIVDNVRVVTISENDILNTYDLPLWQKGYQDCKVFNEKLFVESGANPTLLNVYDINNGNFIASVDLNTLSNNQEPEGLSIYNEKLYMSFVNGDFSELTF